MKKPSLNQDERGSLNVYEPFPHVPYRTGPSELLKPRLRLQRFLAQFRLFIKRLTVGQIALFIAPSIIVIISFHFVSFFVPRTVQLSYATSTCVKNPMLLPKLIQQVPQTGYSASADDTIRAFGYPLYASKTCVKPTTLPKKDTQARVTLAPLGVQLFHQRLAIKVGTPPSLKQQFNNSVAVASSASLYFRLDTPDQIFSYQLHSGSKTSECQENGSGLLCNLTPLALPQGKKFDIKLERHFQEQTDAVVFAQSLITTDPLQVTKTSIAQKQQVFSVPMSIDIDFSKTVGSVDDFRLEQVQANARTAIPVTKQITGSKLKIVWATALPRNSQFELTITKASGIDLSQFDAPFVLAFQTSGGPKVLVASIGTYKVSTSAKINLHFDSGLKAGQAFDSLIKLEIGGKTIAARIVASGQTVTITPVGELPKCTPFTVRVVTGLINEFGVPDGSAWQLNSRTICQNVFSIGSSVLGRGLTAYRFGTGASSIVFVGGTHGDEKSSVSTLNSLIEYLEANALSIPANRTIFVIPDINPDGYAASKRLNAHNIDLNRNFPAINWQSDVYEPGNVHLPSGGGNAPLSEPESNALANFIIAQQPRLILTYHAWASAVVANDSGDSFAQAKTYGNRTGYQALSNGSSADIFDYSTTGEFEDWLHDKLGLPALLIELSSMSSNEFNNHKNAMWAMVQSP